MKANTSKEKSFYTQGQQFTARVLCIAWLLAIGSPESILAIPKRQMTPAPTTSPGDPSLAGAPPTLPPGGILQLPPDSLGAFWGGSVASSPSIERVLQQRMRQEAAPDKGHDLLRTSPKVSPVEEHWTFQAREGESVCFHCQMGQWRAEVSSHIGSASRRAVLPVVCSQGTDVTSSLEVLSRYPSWQRQRQIHVLDRNLCPTLGEVVYVGELGLKGGVGGGGGEALKRKLPSSNDNPPQDRKKLRSAEPKLNPAEADSPSTVDQLKTLASDPQIDQQPDKLAELGKVLLTLATSKQEEAGDSAEDFSSYTEAAILCQHVLSICEQKVGTLCSQEASALEKSAYQGLAQIQASMLAQAKRADSEAITVEEVQARISADKQRLEAIRTKARAEAERLAAFRDQQGSEEEVRYAEAAYIEGSKKLFADIAEASKNLLANFYKEAEEELKAAGIERPCKYTVMGLGSLALKQTTPYSDLEFAILMEDAQNEEETRTYLRNLTHLVHFRVINLGETVLPFSQYEVSLDHLGRKGLNFDLGGKTPLGRKDKDYELIQPVSKMAAYMQNEGGKMEQMDKLLPYILESTCHICGDNSLYEAYEATQASFLEEQAASGKREYQQRIAKKLLQGTADLSRQQPGDIPGHRPSLAPIDAGKLCNVKEEIYRLADRLLYGLAFYYGLRPQSGWDAVDQLQERNKIHAEAARHLKYMASFAAMLRLETYLHHGQQNEQLSLRGSLSQGGSGAESSQAAHELLMLPSAALEEDGSLFRYYYTALPLHQQMEEFFEMLNLRQEVRKNAVVDERLQEVLFSIEGKYAAPQEGAYFQSEPFYDDSCAVKLGVYNRLQQYDSARECAAEHHKEAKERYFYNTKKLARYHHNLAIACYNSGRFDESQDHFTRSVELLEEVYPKGHAEVSYMLKIQRNKGIYHYNRGEHNDGYQCFYKSWQLLQAFYNDNHPETAQMLLSLGEVYEAMGNFQESLKHKSDALKMLQSLYTEHHPAKARALLSLGDAYAAMGQLAASRDQKEDSLAKFQQSLDHKQCALQMFKDFCGRSHLEVARALLSLGDVHASLENFSESLKHKEASLSMFQDLYGSSHPEVARALLSVGESYEAMGQLTESKEYKHKSVAMFEMFYKDTHSEVIQARKSLSRTESAHISALEGGNPVHTSAPSLPRVRIVHPQPLTLLPTPRYGKEPAGENTLLKNYYSKTDFPYVKSLFDEQDSKHVKALECQLMLFRQELIKQDKKEGAGSGDREDHIAKHHERLEWFKTPIGSEDLFKKRSIRPGDPEKEISRILLTGDPGTGKTTLSRQLAYQWSEGQWGQEFHTLYLIPVRSLQQSEYDGTRYNREKTLSTAIVNTCFSHDLPATEAEYTSLRAHIDQELDKPTTLVILDGLDERAGASKEILRQAQSGTHKLLMLSRPYGIETERQRVDIEIEHVGFNRAQLKAYVQSEVPDSDRSAELLGYINKHENIRSIAHVPLNLQILCALWQDPHAGISHELEQGSLPGLYSRFTKWVWNRYTKKWDLKDKTCDELFDILGKVGLDALKNGQLQISPDLIQQYAKTGRAKDELESAGFLLLQYVGEDAGRQSGFYEFPHLTFQEYFAGRTLAQQCLSKEEEEREEASDFLSEHKYERQYGRTLLFMAGEVSRRPRGVKGIKELLKLLGARDQELVGVQYLRLQLRLVHEWLCIASEQEAEKGMNKLENDFQVLSSLEKWFERAFAHVRLEGYGSPRYDTSYLPGRRLLGLLKSSLQTFGSIVRYAPGLLELFKGAVQGPHGAVRLAAVSSLGGAMAGVYDEARDMLQAMADDRHEAYDIQQAARQSLSQATGAESTQDEAAVGGGAAQGSLGEARESASQSPEALLEQLRQAAKAAEREDDKALRSSRGSLVQAVAAASQEEFGALLDLLLPAAQDWNGLARAAAQEALWKAPIEELLAFYWSTPDTRLIPYIIPRLYHTPLVIAKSVRSGHQRVSLYAAAGQAREWRQPQGVVADFERYVQDAVSQLSHVESKLSAHIDKSVWEQYFGAVGEEPALPDGIEAILNSPCPFWDGRQVRDTHMLVLIPSHVGGKPLTLDSLGELIKSPQGDGHGTKYSFYYVGDIRNQSPDSSYWVLMTRDVLLGSRAKSYVDQCALLSGHAKRTGISYEVPGTLEAAVVTLLHHVRSGERLYSDNPFTYTRCQKSVNYQPVVGGFSSGGLSFVAFSNYDYRNYGVSALRKF